MKKWNLREIWEWTWEKLIAFARFILDIPAAIGYWGERHVTSKVGDAVGWVRGRTSPVWDKFAYWLERKLRKARRWCRERIQSIVQPVVVALTPVWHWMDRRLGGAIGWCRVKAARVAAPLGAVFSALAYWVEKHVFGVLGYWLQRRIVSYVRRHFKKLLVITASVVIVLAALLFWQGRPMYHKFKERRFLELARLFVDKGEDLKALICARNVLAYNPQNLAASEILAGLAERSKSPQALTWRRRVVELAPTLDNRLKLADSALRYEAPPFPLAAKTLEELSATDKQTVPFHLASARFALRLQQWPKAESHFEEALRLEPTNELHRLNLAVLRLRATNAAVALSARTTLESFRTHTNFGVEALRALIADGLARKDLPAARVFSHELLAHPRSGFTDRLLHLSILKELRSADLTAALESAQAQSATNALQAADLGNWMIARGQAKAALPWLQSLDEKVRVRQPVPLTLATAFQASEDWRGLQEFLHDQSWGDQDFIRLALSARASRKQGEEEVAEAYWQQATRLASERPELTAILAQTIRAWGWTNETEQLLSILSTRYAAQPWALQYVFQQYHAMGNTQGLFQVFSAALNPQSTNAAAREAEALLTVMNSRFGAEPWALWVSRSLFQYYVGTGNTRGIYQILSTALNRGSEDVVLKNNLAAAAMLLQTNLPMAHTLARQVYELEPGNGDMVATYAYSLHLQGRNSEALRVMQNLSAQDLKRPSVAVYYGFLLAAAGQTARAKDYLATADAGSLLPEEKELVLQARRSAWPKGP